MLIRIGACEIDCDRRRIVREGVERPLPPKAFDLLLTLVAQRPKVVSKDALIKEVWSDTFVADANLAILIGDIRSALGDSARKPQIIRTHHRVGYSFIADVSDNESFTVGGRQPTMVLAVGRRRILLFEQTVTIGRDETCDIVLDHLSVSRLHGRLTVDGQVLTIEDNASKNGIKVDDVRLTAPTQVRAGQRVVFGSVEAFVLNHLADDGSTLTVADA